MKTWLRGTKRVAGSLKAPGSFSRNVATTLFTQAFMLALGVVSSAVTARLLGAYGKGLVSMVSLVQGVLVLVFNMGIGVANVQFAGSKRQSLESLTGHSVAFALTMAAIGVPLAAAIAAFGWLGKLVPNVSYGYLFFGIVGFPLVLLGVYFACILQGFQRIPETNKANVLQGIASLVLMVGLVYVFKFGVWGALIATLGANVAGTALRAYYLRRAGASLMPKWDGPALRSMLGFGLKGHVGNLLQFFNYRADVFITNWFLGPAAVGLYSVAVSLAELLWQFPQAASYVIFPKAASAKAEEMNRFTPRVLWITMAVTLLGAFGLTLLGPLLIKIIFSSKFAGSYVPMLALLPGVVLLGGGKILTNDIAGRGHPQYNSVTSGIVLTVTIVLTLWWIPRYGILGAAAASSVAYATAFLVSLFVYRRVSRQAVALSVSAVQAEQTRDEIATEEGAL